MDYKQSWDDMHRWLTHGVEYLEHRESELLDQADNVHGHIRVKAKLNGLKTCLNHMNETERIYKSEESE